jgi:hypothetical protein
MYRFVPVCHVFKSAPPKRGEADHRRSRDGKYVEESIRLTCELQGIQCSFELLLKESER